MADNLYESILEDFTKGGDQQRALTEMDAEFQEAVTDAQIKSEPSTTRKTGMSPRKAKNQIVSYLQR